MSEPEIDFNNELALSNNTLVLSDRDWDLFVSLIENPPEPSEALKSAMKEYLEEYEIEPKKDL
ncbi:MAG: DUF1778 domain-containing protein [Okeania sp. SIO2H7]|nr:DUF1778 domain-containing protein [Okeania sp. SIO2H7]